MPSEDYFGSIGSGAWFPWSDMVCYTVVSFGCVDRFYTLRLVLTHGENKKLWISFGVRLQGIILLLVLAVNYCHCRCFPDRITVEETDAPGETQ